MDKKGKEGGSIFTDRSQTTKTGEAPLRLRIWKKKLIKNVHEFTRHSNTLEIIKRQFDVHVRKEINIIWR